MEKHQAIVFGEKVRVMYDVYRWDACEVRETYEVIDNRVVIFDGFIDNPPLEIKEKIYIKNIGKNIEISDKSRNLDGGYVYSTNHIAERISDEKTVQSKIEAEELLAKTIEEHKKRIAESAKKEVQEKYNALPFYKKWFTKSI